MTSLEARTKVGEHLKEFGELKSIHSVSTTESNMHIIFAKVGRTNYIVYGRSNGKDLIIKKYVENGLASTI